MTFCVALKSRAGIVALADTQIVRGSEQLTKAKIHVVGDDGGSWFVMTSGLRSVRDKLVIYAEEALEALEAPCDRLYKIANIFGEQMQRVRLEDGEALAASKLPFNAHGIIGGRLAGDAEPTLFYLYPEGNWIEVASDSPWFMIGRTYYGKPILDRLMSDDASLDLTVALAILAFDATQTSVTDVAFPIDMLSIAADTRIIREHRFAEADLVAVTDWWDDRLKAAIGEMPMEWAAPLLDSDHPGPPSLVPLGTEPPSSPEGRRS